MEILGVNLIQGNFKTLELEFDDFLNVEILEILDKFNIDKVYTHWIGDIHHDHKNLAYSSLHSCRHVPNLLMYRSNWYHSTYEFRGNYYVDITDFWQMKERSVMAHESELHRVGNKWIEFFHNEAANAGQRIGVKYAEVFEIVKLLER
jgi:LmbE family N-acetylglucosaminyl deacetylase